MKTGTVVGIIIGVIVAAVAVIALIVLVIFPLNRESNSQTKTTPAISGTLSQTSTLKPASSSTASSAASTVATSTASNIALTTVSVSATTKTTVTSTTPVNKDVNFAFYVNSVNTSPLSASATVTSQLSNTGTADAHNTWAKLEVFQQGKSIPVDGEDFFRYNIGTLKAGETRQVQVTLKFSFLDALQLVQSGATLNLTIYSDEKTQTMSYDYKP